MRLFFLVDANASTRVVSTFEDLGFGAEYVNDIPKLLNQPDELIFDYAVKKRAIIVTRDKGFANPLRFDLSELSGLILIRFPNEIKIITLCEEIYRLLKNFKEKDFYQNLIVVEPGQVRKVSL